MAHDARMAAAGIDLPGPFAPHAPLLGVVVHGDTARTSGALPRNADGAFPALGVCGAGVSTEDGVVCARLALLNAVSLLRAELGSLDQVARVLTITVFVASTPDFAEQPTVADGASRALLELFGDDAGRHTRSAIGVASLPRGAPVEVELTVALTSG